MATTQASGTTLAGYEEADRGLRKTMGFNSILFMSLGGIIGSGWLLGALASASVAGPAAILSWVIGGIFVIFIAVSYAELSGMLPRTGAIVRYPQLSHGAYTGWMIGWTYWLSAISVPAIEAEAVITYIGGVYPGLGWERVSDGVTLLTGTGTAVGVGFMVFFFALNLFGIRLLSEWNRWFTWWKVLVPTATFVMLFIAFRSTSFHAYGGFFARGTSNIFVAMSTTGVIFAYLGFRQALDYAGESKNPQRDVPLATILSVVIAMILYTLLEVGFIGALNWHAAGLHLGDWAGLSASKWGGAPLYSALQAAGIGALLTFSNLLIADAAASPSGTGWIYMGTSARTNYGLGVNGYGPKALQRHNRWGIPWISLLIALVIGCVFLVPAPSWYKLVGYITSTTALTYIMGGLGVPIFRRYAPDLPRPFRLGFAKFWAPVGFIAASLLVFWSTFNTLANVYATVFLGLPLFAWYYAVKRGWLRAGPAAALGAVFLAAWVYISIEGGYVLRVTAPAKGSWSFGLYDATLSAAVILFCAGLWMLSNAEGRYSIERSLWFFFLLLAYFPLEFYTQAVTPSSTAPLSFLAGSGIAVVIGLVAYYWGVASGYMTDELQAIVDANAAGSGKSVDRGAAVLGD